MARYGAPVWRAMALAAVTGVALGVICAPCAEAQSARKGKQKQAEQKQAEPEQASDGDQAKAAEKKKKMTAAEAQAAVDAALKLLEAGKAEQAAQALTATLAGGRLPPAIMAKALVYRGIAYRQQKKPAQAIADLTSALWLKGGLSESERRDALSQRAAAYQEAGLTESGEAIAAAVPSAPRATTRTASASSATWGAATTAAAPPTASLASESQPEAPKASGEGWNLFGNLFGGASAAAPAAPPAAVTPPKPEAVAPAPAATSRPTKSASAWTSNTEVRGASAPAETAALQTRPDGQFRVQVGMVRTQDQAQALAAKVKSQYAAALGQREPQIDEAVVGNMGSFYRVRVGPFVSSQEGQAACAKLKGSGLDCLVVTQ